MYQAFVANFFLYLTVSDTHFGLRYDTQCLIWEVFPSVNVFLATAARFVISWRPKLKPDNYRDFLGQYMVSQNLFKRQSNCWWLFQTATLECWEEAGPHKDCGDMTTYKSRSNSTYFQIVAPGFTHSKCCTLYPTIGQAVRKEYKVCSGLILNFKNALTEWQPGFVLT